MFRILAIWSSFFLLCFALTLLYENQAQAQNATELGASFSPKGLSTEEFSKRYGKPDKKRTHSDRKESWTYGESLVFFTDGHVSAWSDAGELAGRKNLSSVRDSTAANHDSYASAWINAWTPGKTISRKKVLWDLLENKISETTSSQIQSQVGSAYQTRAQEGTQHHQE